MEVARRGGRVSTCSSGKVVEVVGLDASVERWEVVVVMRRPGLDALEREGGGGGGDVTGCPRWCQGRWWW
jgi:hypothetical protein